MFLARADLCSIELSAQVCDIQFGLVLMSRSSRGCNTGDMLGGANERLRKKEIQLWRDRTCASSLFAPVRSAADII